MFCCFCFVVLTAKSITRECRLTKKAEARRTKDFMKPKTRSDKKKPSNRRCLRRLVRRMGKNHMDVVLQIRILLPEKENYPIINRPWIRMETPTSDGRFRVSAHNYVVLKEISAPHDSQTSGKRRRK
jgi:hypothetical protein